MNMDYSVWSYISDHVDVSKDDLHAHIDNVLARLLRTGDIFEVKPGVYKALK